MRDLSYKERLDVREQIARIDTLLADIQKQREHHMQPWQVALVVLGGAAAFFAAGAAFTKMACLSEELCAPE